MEKRVIEVDVYTRTRYIIEVDSDKTDEEWFDIYDDYDNENMNIAEFVEFIRENGDKPLEMDQYQVGNCNVKVYSCDEVKEME